MQDDLLMDKSQSQQRQQSAPTSQAQQQDHNSSEVPCAAEPPSPENNSTPTLKEKMQMESPILPGLSFPQPGQQEPHTGPSLSPSFGSTWSTGGTSNAVDDSFFQGITPVNGTMLFQNFPHHHHHVNPVFGGTFSPQLGLAHQTHQQQQRRSPVSPNNQPPYNQRNAYSHQAILTNKPSTSSSSPSPSSWNNQQNASWNNPSNPWGGLQPGRDPRRAVGVGVGVGVGVPSPLNPISPLKKPFSSNVIAPPKFPRASPLAPKSWVEDNAFRTDNGNNLLPLQVPNNLCISDCYSLFYVYVIFCHPVVESTMKLLLATIGLNILHDLI